MLLPITGVPDPGGADCVGCGRCCHHPPRTVHLLESDDARMSEGALVRLTVLDSTPPSCEVLRFAQDDSSIACARQALREAGVARGGRTIQVAYPSLRR